MKILFTFSFLVISSFVLAQKNLPNLVSNDTVKKLSTVTIIVKQQSPERLHELDNNSLFSGKKNEDIRLATLNANITPNNALKVLSKVPVVYVL